MRMRRNWVRIRPIAVACYIAIIGKIDAGRWLAHKLRFTSLANVCYIARNAVTDCLNDSVEPGADTPRTRYLRMRMRPSRNGTPAYKKIQNVIRKRIEGGQLKIGDSVDSERELARIHGVSLMTARHALASLEREGVVERRRGSGTFVAPPKVHFNKLMSYTEQMASRGLVACSRLLCIKLIDREPEIAARLALPANSQLVKVERLRQAANEPFALEACYLSAEEMGGLVS